MNSKTTLWVSILIMVALLVILILIVIHIPRYNLKCLTSIAEDYCNFYDDYSEEWSLQTWSLTSFSTGFTCIEKGGSERTGFYEIPWVYYFTKEELERCSK